MRHAFVALIFASAAALAPPAAAQQITTAVIQGTVVDSTGAVLPGTTVEAVNIETNLMQTRTTGSDGRFAFLQLPPGGTR
jgi:hypothetical protein